MEDFHILQDQYLKKLRKVTKEKIERGALIEAALSEEDGLVFTDGRRQKPKKLIIIGVDKKEDVCYGALLVNSKINPKAGYSDEYMSAQYLIQKECHPDFLRYDSYVDCSIIFTLHLSKLLNGEYFGKLNDVELREIFDILETSDILMTKDKKRFNIKRR